MEIDPTRMPTYLCFLIAGLDFLEMVKMINFIRAEGRAVGPWPPDLSSRDAFQSEHWLRPQLEDDALLYSLHDIIGEDLEDEMCGVTLGVCQIEAAQAPPRGYSLSRDPRPDNPIYRVAEMEQKVKSAQRDLERHKQLLESDMQLHSLLNTGLTREENRLEAGNSPQEVHSSETETVLYGNTSIFNGDSESSYFASYSGHGKCFFFFFFFFGPNADVDRHSRNYVKRHSPNGCLQRFHLRKQGSFQEQDCTRCWMRDWYIVHVLRSSWSQKSNSC